MRYRYLLSLSLLILFLPSSIQAGVCGSWGKDDLGKTCTIDLAKTNGSSTNVIRGPKCVQVDNINPLRYEIRVDNETTLKNLPDFSQVFLNPASLLGKDEVEKKKKEVEEKEEDLEQKEDATPRSHGFSTQGAETTVILQSTLQQREIVARDSGVDNVENPDTRELHLLSTYCDDPVANCPPPVRRDFALLRISAELDQIYRKYDDLSKRAKQKANEAKSVLSEIAARQESVEQLISGSDRWLAMGAEAKWMIEKVEEVQSRLAAASPEWPEGLGTLKKDVQKLLEEASELEADVRSFRRWSQPNGQTRLVMEENEAEAEALVDELVPAVLDLLETLDPDKDKHKIFQKGLDDLADWAARLGNLTEEHFTFTACGDCGAPFSKQKTHTIKMTRLDRTLDGAKVETSTLITIECPQNFTTSFGFSVAGLSERAYKFVDARGDDGTLVQEIGYEKESDQQVNAVLLLNALLQSRPGGNIYASVGPTLELNNAESGVQLGFAAGVSYGIRENWLLTLGAQIGRERELSGGFTVGDAVPMGLNEPPTELEWKTSWALMFSYKVR